MSSGCHSRPHVQTSVGSLRYWTLTGKLAARPAAIVDGKRAIAERALRILDEQFSARPFIVGDGYTIADISIFAYAHLPVCRPRTYRISKPGSIASAGCQVF